MSDEFLPPSGPPVEDDPPAPDESGFGYYAVDEYTGDPALRPLVDQPPPTSGRVPFAERNWRIPLIGVLIAAMVVLVTVIVLLPDDGLVLDDSSRLVELRVKPTKQWDEDLDGFASSVAADAESMYLVVVKPRATELVALDLATGDERWSLDIGPAGRNATGSVAVVGDRLAVVFSGGSSSRSGSFAMVDPANGKISWQTTVGHPVAAVVSDSVIGAVADDGGSELLAIDSSRKRVGEAVHADEFFLVHDLIYLDNDGVLATADAKTLQPTGTFRYRHDEPIVDPLRVGDDVVLGHGEEIVRLDRDGAEKYSFDAQVGIIRNLLPMAGDRILVSSATRMRVVALNDADAEASTPVRSGVSPVLVHDIDDDEFIVAFDGADRGLGPATLRVMRVDGDDFDQVSEIELVSSDGAPPLSAAGTTGYAMSFGTARQFVAFDLNTGQRLWSLAVPPDGEITATSNGLIVLTREDDESVVGFYSDST